MKMELKGRRFEDAEDAQKKSKYALNYAVTQDYTDCFEHWKSRLKRCIQAKGFQYGATEMFISAPVDSKALLQSLRC